MQNGKGNTVGSRFDGIEVDPVTTAPQGAMVGLYSNE